MFKLVDYAGIVPRPTRTEEVRGPEWQARGADAVVVGSMRQQGDRVDVRFAKDINLPAGVKVTGIAEVFNLFNHENYGAYNGQVNSTTFGEPRQNLLNAYQPRVIQLAFRVGF